MDIDITTTLESDPGTFGAALGTLGFTEARESGTAWVFPHPSGITVRCYSSDVAIVSGHTAEGDPWQAEFEPTTPQAIVLGTIAVAVGRLSITR